MDPVHSLNRFKLKFLVLDHLSSDDISPSGVVSITPNEDLKIPRWANCIQTMNLLNMKIKVWIYATEFKNKTKNQQKRIGNCRYSPNVKSALQAC